jgi:MFS family permease
MAAFALLLHGFCFTFVFAVASLYVNEIAPVTIRASAQALVTIGLFGFGRFFGSQVAGVLHDFVSRPIPPTQIGTTTYHSVVAWNEFFATAGVGALITGLALAGFFREPQHQRDPKPV